MLPIINTHSSISPELKAYLKALDQADFQGDIDASYSTRLTMAVDNSIYQQIPQAVLFPKNSNDIVLLTTLASEENYQSIRFSPRGGGTGCNGQSLSEGVIVDVSRYMNQILEINPEEKWVRVESGAIKDQLNDVLKPHGLFFAPDLSTSNRAVIGGMVNTDASGQGSLVYGKTSDHVLGLKSVTVDGVVLDTKPVSWNKACEIAKQKGRLGEIYQQVTHTVSQYKDEITARFPPLNRFLTGYDLKHVVNDDTVDIGRLICGSEGTLAFVTEAKLNLEVIPKYRTLVNIKYDNFDSALNHAPFLVEAKATSVETIDSNVLDLARQDVIWYDVESVLESEEKADFDGLNLVEFSHSNQTKQNKNIEHLCQQLDTIIKSKDQGVVGYQITNHLEDIQKIYSMRKKAVGLLANTKGNAKPTAFVEDTCVPPENLATFIGEFRDLLDQAGLQYGMFGHVDSGVLHVRPSVDLTNPEYEKLVHQLSRQVVDLVKKYHGVMWGEHGKGFRSEYVPEYFGEILYPELQKIKAAFDPHNRLNPGKICTAWGDNSVALSTVKATKRAKYDKQIPVTIRDDFSQVIHCNGNGLCFTYDTRTPMCPSWKATGDRRYSPKGRAMLIREWLRQASLLKVDFDKLLGARESFGSEINKIFFTKQSKQDDFSHEVMNALSTCLSCKSCSTQCPTHVDIPDLYARFQKMYYTRHRRALSDYFIGFIEPITLISSKIKRLSNALQGVAEKTGILNYLGVVNPPYFSCQPSVTGQFDLAYFQSLSKVKRDQHVFIVQDVFTSFYDIDLLNDLLSLIKQLGKVPILLPLHENGKPLYVKGFLNTFQRTAGKTAEFLNQVAQLEIPMVGIDPAMVLCYRDEYQKALGDKRGRFHISLIQEWLLNLIKTDQLGKIRTQKSDRKYYLLGHCTEKTMNPSSSNDWKQIFDAFGLQLETIPIGCCGMSGSFGHEKKNLKLSQKIYQISWEKEVEQHEESILLATGYSCRCQIGRFSNKKSKHPIQILVSSSDSNGFVR